MIKELFEMYFAYKEKKELKRIACIEKEVQRKLEEDKLFGKWEFRESSWEWIGTFEKAYYDIYVRFHLETGEVQYRKVYTD